MKNCHPEAAGINLCAAVASGGNHHAGGHQCAAFQAFGTRRLQRHQCQSRCQMPDYQTHFLRLSLPDMDHTHHLCKRWQDVRSATSLDGTTWLPHTNSVGSGQAAFVHPGNLQLVSLSDNTINMTGMPPSSIRTHLQLLAWGRIFIPVIARLACKDATSPPSTSTWLVAQDQLCFSRYVCSREMAMQRQDLCFNPV